MDNHIVDDCYCEGGGKEGQAPWNQKKKKNSDLANVADQSSSSEVKSYGFTTIIDNKNVELIATTDCQAQAEALATSGIPYDGELIDIGASHHFSSARSKMINFMNIKPTPICTAGGHSFDAIGRGDYITYLPMGHGKPATKVTLFNTYYSPHLVFMLISVSCLDTAGYSLTVEDGNSYTKTPKPDRHVIGIVPKVNGLYCI